MATTTSRLGLTKPATTDNVDITVLDANFDQIDLKMCTQVCTSSTRPSSPFTGQLIWETDTTLVRVWTGAAWVTVPGMGTTVLAVTSSTHPASPAAGQVILETDTGATLVWSGSAWVPVVNTGAAAVVGATGTTAALRVQTTSTLANNRAVGLRKSGDANDAYSVDFGGKTQWGAGGGTALDTDLYRPAAATLATDGNLAVGGAGSFGGAAGALSVLNATTTPTSNPTGGIVIYANGGGLFARDTTGIWALTENPPAGAVPNGALAETIPRWAASSVSNVLLSGTLFLQAIWLTAGQTVSNITFVSGNTAATSPTHWWFNLVDKTFIQRAHTADQTTTAFPANTAFTKAVTTPYVATYTGLYYLGIMMTFTTSPTLLECGLNMANGSVTSPPAGGASSTGQTVALADGSSVTTITSNTGYAVQYAYAS